MITPMKCGEDDPQSRIYVASLITSFHYGQRVDPPDDILANTARAIQSLSKQMHEIQQNNRKNAISPIRELWSVRLNSGLFKVPWERTKAVLQESGLQMDVVSISEDVAAPSIPEQGPVIGNKQGFVKNVSQETDSDDDHSELGLTKDLTLTTKPMTSPKISQGSSRATRATRSHPSTRGVARGAVGKSTNYSHIGRSKKQKHTADWLKGLEGITEDE